MPPVTTRPVRRAIRAAVRIGWRPLLSHPLNQQRQARAPAALGDAPRDEAPVRAADANGYAAWVEAYDTITDMRDAKPFLGALRGAERKLRERGIVAN